MYGHMNIKFIYINSYHVSVFYLTHIIGHFLSAIIIMGIGLVTRLQLSCCIRADKF